MHAEATSLHGARDGRLLVVPDRLGGRVRGVARDSVSGRPDVLPVCGAEVLLSEVGGGGLGFVLDPGPELGAGAGRHTVKTVTYTNKQKLNKPGYTINLTHCE